MSLIKQHLGKGLKVQLKNADGEDFELTLMPIGIQSMDYFLDVAEHIDGLSDGSLDEAIEKQDMKEISKAFSKEARKAVNAMIMATLRVSFPNEDERDLSVLASQNYDALMQGAMQVNAPQQTSHEDLKKKFIEERLQARKNESATKD